MRRAQLQRRVVAHLRIGHLAPLLERIREVAVRVREVRLQLDRLPIRVDREFDMSCIASCTTTVCIISYE